MITTQPLARGYDRETLQDLVRATFGVGSEWLATQKVTVPRPESNGQVWTADVEEFRLLGHPRADRCYVVLRGGPHCPDAFHLCQPGIQRPEDAAAVMLFNEQEDRVSG